MVACFLLAFVLIIAPNVVRAVCSSHSTCFFILAVLVCCLLVFVGNFLAVFVCHHLAPLLAIPLDLFSLSPLSSLFPSFLFRFVFLALSFQSLLDTRIKLRLLKVWVSSSKQHGTVKVHTKVLLLYIQYQCS